MSSIGRYEVEHEIGRGAMGRVYAARDPRLRRRVAVKVHALPQGLSEAQEQEFRTRFLREAQAAALLSHPGIVTVYDADEDPQTGLPFIAMEHVEGGSLRQLLDEQERVETGRAREIGAALADALQAAHAAGIVHRDVKPANVLLRAEDGAVKIADFGVARLATSQLTQSGASLGSPAYMSPEQVRGKAVDGRSDLFSLAVLLYESLCGVRPFTGEDFTALAYAIVHETPVPVTKRAADLPHGLDRFFDRALAKEPGERFANGAEFAQALDAAFVDDGAEDHESTVVDASPAAGGEADADADVVENPAWDMECDEGPLPLPEGDISRRVRRRIFVIAACFLLLIVAAWALLGGEDDAYLKLDAKSSMESGELSLLVDGKEVYSRSLSAPEKKGKGLLKKIVDKKHETFEAWIEVPPGKHEVVAHVIAEGDDSGYRDTVVVDLQPGETRRLRMTAGRAFGSGTGLSLRVN